MSIDSEFLELMSDTITLKSVSGRDAYNVVTYGTGVSYSARVVHKTTLIRSSNGSEILAKGVVWVYGAPVVTEEDQITLSDGSTPPILGVDRYSDEDGDYFTKVYFG